MAEAKNPYGKLQSLPIGDTPEQLNLTLGHTVKVIFVGNKAYTEEDIRQLELKAGTAAFDAESQRDMKAKAREQRDKATKDLSKMRELLTKHGICEDCGNLYTRDNPDEPFASCGCHTSEWYDDTPHMTFQRTAFIVRSKLVGAINALNAVLLEEREERNRLRAACQLAIDMFKANNVNVPNTIETLEDALA
jgi:hypothetical protein